MKAIQFSFCILFSLAFTTISNAQNVNNGNFNADLIYKSSEKIFISGDSKSTDIDEPTCQYPECTDLIEQMVQYYQPYANSSCVEIPIPITCCDNGFEMHIMILVQPDAPACNQHNSEAGKN